MTTLARIEANPRNAATCPTVHTEKATVGQSPRAPCFADWVSGCTFTGGNRHFPLSASPPEHGR